MQNIVASMLNLNAIAIGLGLENIEYGPDQFPGLAYSIDKPEVVVLLSSSGKLVVTGGKEPKDAEEAIAQIISELGGPALI
jgi:transcription initiation factor TFIID TATA-box-binding protein